MKNSEWLSVDKIGLGKLLAGKGKATLIHELVQNAWDEPGTTTVRVSLERVLGTRRVRLTVEDDNPDGFSDLRHAYTLFAESSKKGNPTQRGRFNLGEKLVLALCHDAEIRSTSGAVRFNSTGRTKLNSLKTNGGSVFSGELPMTTDEMEQCNEAMSNLIVPHGVSTFFNNVEISHQTPIEVITDIPLVTEISDDDGVLRRSRRKTTLSVYEPQNGKGFLYEMGIPVCETGDRWNVDVGQKVPLTLDRSSVSAAFLASVRAVIVDKMSLSMTSEDANSPWAREAIDKHGTEMSSETLNRIADLRFGENRVSYDPSDPESNSLAASKGYTVIHGRSLSRSEWEAMRMAGAIAPAGKVTPSPKPFHPDGKALKLEINPSQEMEAFVRYAKWLARELMGREISVRIANDPGWRFRGAYGPGELYVNVASVGREWFKKPTAKMHEFLIHEFGHEYSDNHLSSDYHDALCRLGASFVQLCLEQGDKVTSQYLQ